MSRHVKTPCHIWQIPVHDMGLDVPSHYTKKKHSPRAADACMKDAAQSRQPLLNEEQQSHKSLPLSKANEINISLQLTYMMILRDNGIKWF